MSRKRRQRKLQPAMPTSQFKPIKQPFLLEKSERLADIVGPILAAIGLGEAAEIRPRSLPLAAVVEADTPEQRAMYNAAAWARSALAASPRLVQAHALMIAARRIYAIAYRELVEVLEADPQRDSLAIDLLVQAAVHGASQPFSEHTLMNGLLDTEIKGLADIIDRHTKDDEIDAQVSAKRADVVRRASTIPLPFKYDVLNEAAQMRRDRAVILVGWRPAVLWVLDHVCAVWSTLVAPHARAVRFSVRDPQPGDREATRPFFFGPKVWTLCCRSAAALVRVVSEYVAPVTSNVPDLMICDHLSQAASPGFIGRPVGAIAGDAHHVLMRWCKEAGCGLLAGVLLNERPASVDLHAPEYEQLRTFADLVSVNIEDTDNDTYRVVLGAYASVYEGIDRAAIDGQATTAPKLII